ncbi:metabolite traffic protein EboE [Streptomyces sp. NBC_01363]|uniref:metabolite traffic protein EboE n=1 Tax=Streptomyces sp. NBC_01363 TaxID=2903840 RepID=UPI0022573CE7|nr:metabolite traffic protein EboE [Streptomyces sp. NBC_01363]MCX4733322.1 metabolite traffic protein EboE [Streptomyces sp. NBC_01363]
MRFSHADGSTVHLSYCTNVHPAESLDGIVAQLDRWAVPVRERLSADRLGVGLWLPRRAASELSADPAATGRLRRALATRGLEAVSLNAFPYEAFHAPRVKRDVYRPDWADPERLRYTLDLARILARLLPDDAARGSISTLPLGWRPWWSSRKQSAADAALDRLAEGLEAVAAEEGRPVRVGFEPEPGCIVERTEHAVELLAGRSPGLLGVCLDTCHLAVAFEDPAAALKALAAAGVPVVKLQASCALHVPSPRAPGTAAALADFDEPRFLHQTREAATGLPLSRDDLDEALGPDGLPGDAPWRVHFHIPLHATPPPPIGSTRQVLRDTLAGLFGAAAAGTDHVEVETYTWNVLPPGRRPSGPSPLAAGIAAELDWMSGEFLDLGLKEARR